MLEDTTGISRGSPLLTEFDVFRDPTGAVRARGRIELPDGTRLQLSLYRPGSNEFLARTQFAVRDRQFESVPLSGGEGGLPEALYRVELVTYFDSAWQPREVMVATDNGRAVRGPGVVYGRNGIAAFIHTEDQRL